MEATIYTNNTSPNSATNLYYSYASRLDDALNLSHYDFYNIAEQANNYSAGGATASVVKLYSGKYNVVITGNQGYMTSLKNISLKSLNRLKKNYEWIIR